MKRTHWSQQTPSFNNTRENSTRGHHQTVIPKSDWLAQLGHKKQAVSLPKSDRRTSSMLLTLQMGKIFQMICNKIQVRLISQPPFSDSVKGKSLTWVYTTIPPSDRKVFLFTLFSSKNVTNSHWTAVIQTKGKLGNGNASLITSIHKHSKGPSVMVETYSRNSVVVMWAWCETLQRRAGLQSNSRSPSFLFFPCGIAPPLMACQYPAHLLGSAQMQSPMKPSWTHLFLLGS